MVSYQDAEYTHTNNGWYDNDPEKDHAFQSESALFLYRVIGTPVNPPRLSMPPVNVQIMKPQGQRADAELASYWYFSRQWSLVDPGFYANQASLLLMNSKPSWFTIGALPAGVQLSTTPDPAGTVLGGPGSTTFNLPPSSDPQLVRYLAAYQRDTYGDWYVSDWVTLTPYGTMGEFDLITEDKTNGQGSDPGLRTTRADKTSFQMKVGLSDGAAFKRLLIPSTNVGKWGVEQGDLYVDILAEQQGQPDRYYNWNAGRPALEATSDGITKLDATWVNPMRVVGVPTGDTPVTVKFTPWSRQITNGITSGTSSRNYPPVELRMPLTLRVCPTATFDVVRGMYLFSSNGGAPTFTGTQGSTVDLGQLEMDSSVVVRVRRAYPRSRTIAVLRRPDGTWKQVGENDLRTSEDCADVIFDIPSTEMADEGAYSIRFLSQTPIDTAAWNTMGVTGVVQPAITNYGWLSVGQINFTYDGVTEINGMLIFAD